MQNYLQKIRANFYKVPQLVRYTFLAAAVFLGSLFIVDQFRDNVYDPYFKKLDAYEQKVNETIDSLESRKKQVKKLEETVAVLQTEKRNLETTVAVEKRNTERLKTKTKVTSGKLDTSKTAADTIVVLNEVITLKDSVIITLETRIDTHEKIEVNLNSQLAKKDSIIQKYVTTEAQVAQVLKEMPKPNKCADKFLFCKLNKPSRVISFVSGVITAGAVVIGAQVATP